MSSFTCDPNLLTGLGAVLSLFFSAAGSALASAHAGIFAVNDKQSYKSFVPIVQAGVLSIYGLIIAVLLIGKLGGGDSSDGVAVLSTVQGYRNLCAGLANGLGSWASGWGMSIFIKQLNDSGAIVGHGGGSTQSELQRPLIQGSGGNASSSIDFKKLVMCMIYLEAIGLYGLIVALFLIGK